MDHDALAELLFPDVETTVAQLEERYPLRELDEGAQVTRMAPSPTGFMHLGNLYGALADERIAHTSEGVFFLRIEDTDQKREVDGGVATILEVFSEYGISFDEGATCEGDEGAYGPYSQSRRGDIYRACVKQLVRQGRAYPCFLTEDELGAMREEQQAKKLNFGCYGSFACYRDTDLAEIQKRIGEGQPYVIRYRSEGSPEGRITVQDAVRGQLELAENDQDVVILKGDGLPTYHFAHVVDDHFMRTTLVVRGEEWLATLPMHVQLFGAMGWEPPAYLHTAHLMKSEGGSKRKLSKRKDPELSLEFYSRKGYSVQAVKEYLMTLLNSNFEEWRARNAQKDLEDFPFSIDKMGVSGALFDIAKLDDISRDVIAAMDTKTALAELTDWARRWDAEFAQLLELKAAYTRSALSIGRGGDKPRKDIARWDEAKAYLSFYYDELFSPDYTLPANVTPEAAKGILAAYAEKYDPLVDSDVWFEDVRRLAEELGFAGNVKEYKKNPDAYPGSVADVSMVLRIAVTGRQQSPDLFQVMRMLGKHEVAGRLAKMAETL